MLNTFLILVFAHLVGDYALQNDFLAQVKGKNDFILAVHSGLWTGAICIGMNYAGLRFGVSEIVFLFALHFMIDRWKARKEDKTNALTKDLYLDQFLHMIQIVGIMLGTRFN